LVGGFLRRTAVRLYVQSPQKTVARFDSEKNWLFLLMDINHDSPQKKILDVVVMK